MGVLFLKESSYAELKRRTENRKEWRIWKPRTTLTAEHQQRRKGREPKERVGYNIFRTA